MSLSLATRIATSSLRTTQAQMAVTAGNIANADTTGYVRKTAEQSSTVTAGRNTGTTVTAITSHMDAYLLRTKAAVEARAGGTAIRASYATAAAEGLGSTAADGSGDSLSSRLTTLQEALASLVDTPESTTLKAQTVASLDDVASSLRQTSADLQSLRRQADSDIGTAVDSVNTALEAINSLNKDIVRAKALGQPTGDLEDQRMAHLHTVSAALEVGYSIDSAGRMSVSTRSGTPLVNSSVHRLEFSTTSTITAESSYSATPPSGLSGITVAGRDITASVKGGEIGALLEVRDSTLPALQAQLDDLAVTFATAFNEAHAGGSAVPAPQTLTGTTVLDPAAALAGSGTLRLAVVDDAGAVSGYQDFDLSSYATVGDLIADLDAMAGVSAALDADGHLVISADDPDLGIALGEDAATIGGQRATLALGTATVVTATGASDIRVAADLLAEPSRLATGSLSMEASLAVGDTALTAGSQAQAEALAAVLNDPLSFGAAGGLAAGSATVAGRFTDILGAATAAADSAETQAATQATALAHVDDLIAARGGVNLDEENARLSDLQQSYQAAATLLETASAMFDALLDAVR